VRADRIRNGDRGCGDDTQQPAHLAILRPKIL